MFMKNIMKKIPVFTAVATLAFLIYILYNKKSNSLQENVNDGLKHEPGSHHITDVFAKAKQYATSD